MIIFSVLKAYISLDFIGCMGRMSFVYKSIYNKMKEKGYEIKRYDYPVKRYCQTMDLKDNPELIAKYRKCHSKVESWPEIRKGIRSVGILEMEIYIEKNHLFMIVETPLDFDWNVAMEQLASLPRQSEWEEYVSAFQLCNSDASSAQKWRLMDRMFYLYE